MQTQLQALLSCGVAQEALPEEVSASLTQELDTKERLLRLTAMVEDCARFLVQAGRLGGLDGASSLDDFLRRVVGCDEAEWVAASTAAVRRSVRLKHLAALYRALEQLATGRAGEDALLSRVPKRYQEPLSALLEEELRTKAARWPDLPRVLDNLTALLQHGTDVKQGFDPLHSLRELIGSADFFETQGEDRWFWEGFPEALQMRHIVVVFRTCTDIANSR